MRFSALKGFEEIDEIINNFTSKWGIEAEIGVDFAAWTFDNTVQYALVVIEDEHRWFAESVSAIDPDIECDPFISALLHEIGHIETAKTISNTDWARWTCQKQELENSVECVENLTREELHQLNLQYFANPIERKATEWAAWYMRENAEEVLTFWNTLQPALMNFYKVNDLI